MKLIMRYHKMTIPELTSKLANMPLVASNAITGTFKSELKDGEEKLRSYVPVDEGNLESAIGSEIDFVSRRRVIGSIFIDGSVPSDDGTKTVDDYLFEMNNHLAPVGGYGLGKKSLAKLSAGNEVGGEFVERAVDYVSEKMEKYGAEVATKIVNGVK